jgi:quercetin dioxygenase-like cupin family protein
MRKSPTASSAITEYDAVGVSLSTLAEGDAFRVTVATFEPGGTIGAHPTTLPQLFHVVDGHGWVSGADGEKVQIVAGEHVVWQALEDHASGSHDGMVVVIVQCVDVEVFSSALR